METEKPLNITIGSNECYLLIGCNGSIPFVIAVFLDFNDVIFALLERYGTYNGDSYYPCDHSNKYDKDKDIWTLDLLKNCTTQYWITKRNFGEIYAYDWREKYYIMDSKLMFLNQHLDDDGYRVEDEVIRNYKPLVSFLNQLKEYKYKS